eukprot:3609804-Rhodomonas_salina.2
MHTNMRVLTSRLVVVCVFLISIVATSHAQDADNAVATLDGEISTQILFLATGLKESWPSLVNSSDPT